MLIAPASAYYGDQIHETTLKRVLQRIEPDIHFDLGSALDIWHPKINRWQGIFLRGRLIGSMNRGWLPEYNIYREEMIADGINDGKLGAGELLQIGWRTTLKQIARRNLPRLSEAELCVALGRDLKRFNGTAEEWLREFVLPEEKVDPLYNTVG